MAETEDLKDVIKESLESRGILGQVKARIRAEVFSALTDETEKKPNLSNENVLINELIREYLDYNNYKYASSVLTSGFSFLIKMPFVLPLESGMNSSPLDRDFLKNELNIVEDGPSRSVPLLYSLVSTYSNKNQPKNKKHGKDGHGAFAEHVHVEKDMENGVCERNPVIVQSGRL